eukprot:m.829286 g.829286  ORF g.829286 m.829286 type:complete len:116 (+) comp23423_c0_seq31:2288-2635(+)
MISHAPHIQRPIVLCNIEDEIDFNLGAFVRSKSIDQDLHRRQSHPFKMAVHGMFMENANLAGNRLGLLQLPQSLQAALCDMEVERRVELVQIHVATEGGNHFIEPFSVVLPEVCG